MAQFRNAAGFCPTMACSIRNPVAGNPQHHLTRREPCKGAKCSGRRSRRGPLLRVSFVLAAAVLLFATTEQLLHCFLPPAPTFTSLSLDRSHPACTAVTDSPTKLAGRRGGRWGHNRFMIHDVASRRTFRTPTRVRQGTFRHCRRM